MDPAVDVRDLTRTFGSFVAVDRIRFEVKSGEVFGFLGSNGAGKSTTIRILCGLLEPTSGQARVGGLDVYTQAEQIKQNIGYMSQRFSLYDELTVEENIDFFGGVYGLRGATLSTRKRQVLETMSLTDLRQSLTRLLPGGWKQRLALACAILHQPRIIFLDEPTSGVDPLARRTFWQLIGELADQGSTVFVTTHYMDEAEHCHRLALMHEGRIIALDSPAALRGSARLADFLHLETEDNWKAFEILEKSAEILDVAVFGGALHIRVKEAGSAQSECARLLADHDIVIRHLRPIQPTMEDVFVALIEAEGAPREAA
jgi:ABC-2 type transport system ATP-binding protein